MFKNSSASYGWFAIFLHWTVALTVFGLFGLGLYMVDLSYYDSWYKTAPDLHRSIGIVLMLALIIRLAWRLLNPRPVPLPNWSALETVTSHCVHVLLYLLMISTIIAGYLISTADGRSIEVFGLFEVPAMLPPIKGMEDIAGEVHEILAWVIMAVAGLHGLAALKHHFIDKDKTLLRMLKPQSE